MGETTDTQLRCPKCGSTALLGKTSGAGPVAPWKCDRCYLIWTDREVRHQGGQR